MLPIPERAIKIIIGKTIPLILDQSNEADSVEVKVIVNSGPAKGRTLTITVSLGDK